MEDRIIVGSVETIDIPSLGVSNVVAKIDTGAWTGALHGTNIQENDGILRFHPLGNTDITSELARYAWRDVRTANGDKVRRYVIPITLVLNGKAFETEITLSNRKLMKREMLIGRRFLIENNILVDVMRTVDEDHEAELYL